MVETFEREYLPRNLYARTLLVAHLHDTWGFRVVGKAHFSRHATTAAIAAEPESIR